VAYELFSLGRVSPRDKFSLAPEIDSCSGHTLELLGTKKTFRDEAFDSLIRPWNNGFSTRIGPNFIDRTLNVYCDSVGLRTLRQTPWACS